MKKVQGGKKINYWIQLTGLIGMDKIMNISEDEYNSPKRELYFAIPKVMSVSFDENMNTAPDTTVKKLVFRYFERFETGIIYKFVGWE